MNVEDHNAEIIKPEEQLDKPDNKAAEIARQAMATEIKLADTDIKVDISKATKIPLGELSSLGVAFAPLLESIEEATQAANTATQTVVTVTDALGNPLPLNMLQAFNDGSGLMGSFRDAAKGFGQVRLHPAALDNVAELADSIPYSPEALFIAAALMEINMKLDAIMETQQEMFEYIKNKDKAELRGNLETLADVLNNYKFNWDNDDYKRAKLNLVQDIKRNAGQGCIQHRAQIKGALDKTQRVVVDKGVRKKSDTVRSELEEYRLAVYLYAFASFLEIMLLENFDSSYLESVRKEIEARSINYRMLYTESYDTIKSEAGSSVRAGVLGAASNVMGFLGGKIEATPIGDATPIDEALLGASRNLKGICSDVESEMVNNLIDASYSDVKPFMDNIDNVNRLYNEPVLLLAGEETAYLLSV